MKKWSKKGIFNGQGAIFFFTPCNMSVNICSVLVCMYFICKQLMHFFLQCQDLKPRLLHQAIRIGSVLLETVQNRHWSAYYFRILNRMS